MKNNLEIQQKMLEPAESSSMGKMRDISMGKMRERSLEDTMMDRPMTSVLTLFLLSY